MSQLPVNPIRALVLGDVPEAMDAIASMLRQEPGVTVATSRAGFGAGARSLVQFEPDVALLLADTLIGADPLATVEELGTMGLRTVLVVLSNCQRHTARDFVLAGARDCLSPPYTRETLAESLRRVRAVETRWRERTDARSRIGQRHRACRVVAVHGAKGGVGSTTIAVNLAVALKKLTRERVALVDASLQTGDVGVSLNTQSTGTIMDLVSNLQELDAELIERVLATHSSGVRVLLAGADMEHADDVSSEQMRRLLGVLSTMFDFIVVDTASTLDAVGLSVLDHAHRVVLVATPEIPALKNAGRFLQITRRLGYPPEKLALVVNRAGSRAAIPLPEIEKSLGVRPTATMPSMGATLVAAANRGEDVVSSKGAGRFSEGVLALARQLVKSGAEGGSSTSRGHGGFLRLWRRDGGHVKLKPEAVTGAGARGNGIGSSP